MTERKSERAELVALADKFDDIEIDADGKCYWSDVANAQTHLRAQLRRAAAVQGEPGNDDAMKRAKDALFNIAKIHGYRLNEIELSESVRAVARALRTTPAATKSAPVFKASHNSGERDPSVMPDWAGADAGGELPPLTCDFAQAFPDGTVDDSTYGKIEDALDKIEAPAQDASGKWLSLHERIAAIVMPDHGGADAGVRPALVHLADISEAFLRYFNPATDLSSDKENQWWSVFDQIKMAREALSRPAPVAANASAEARLREALANAITTLGQMCDGSNWPEFAQQGEGFRAYTHACEIAKTLADELFEEAAGTRPIPSVSCDTHSEQQRNTLGVTAGRDRPQSTHPHASDCDKQKECCDLAAKEPCPDCPYPVTVCVSTKSEGGVEGHAIPRTTSATTTRYPATEGEENMVAPARRTEEQSSTKTGQAGIKPGPSGREKEAAMTEDQIKHMVDRFLGWKLPRDTFNPDCGISFDKEPFNTHTPYPSQHEPSGTNLFDATQATAMVRYMLEGLPRPNASAEARLREALEEAGKGARDIRNELDRTRADRDSWKQQFESASAAASEYSEFWEKHSGEFDQFGNYIPHNQIDGDLRAAKDEIERLKALSTHPHASDCYKQGPKSDGLCHCSWGCVEADNCRRKATTKSEGGVEGHTRLIDDPKLLPLLNDVLIELRHSQTFITSRQKMHPAGVELHEALIERVAQVIRSARDGGAET